MGLVLLDQTEVILFFPQLPLPEVVAGHGKALQTEELVVLLAVDLKTELVEQQQVLRFKETTAATVAEKAAVAVALVLLVFLVEQQ